ncbi:uncharacterized protein LOC132288606 [Cornus florida]|uniref:uncharacterized protein LOC132288606 n=1 Tax=Cornus florida TaxID=4283 RepID=UPI00289BC12D|nr:uncharacterized protein LOC132288606 [Cornus florida]
MPAFWFKLKRSLQCRSKPSDVHDPRGNVNQLTREQYVYYPKGNCNGNQLTREPPDVHYPKGNGNGNQLTREPPDVHYPKGNGNGNGNQLTREPSRSGCSMTISDLKDVIHGGSKRHSMEKQPSCSPRSIRSCEFLNPITHEVVLSDSTFEIELESTTGNKGTSGGSTIGGTFKPGTPGRRRRSIAPHKKPRGTSVSLIKAPNRRGGSGYGNTTPENPEALFGTDYRSYSIFTCHECGQEFATMEAVEAHRLSTHAVTEIVEGDPSRRIVEMIFRKGWPESDNNYGHIDKILKVHNMQETVDQFEEHREMVKMKASKQSKKNQRCLADGNELLRFYGTYVECSFGSNGSYSLCASHECCLCRILRHGFSIKKEVLTGVFTTSTSIRALESIRLYDDSRPSLRSALIICRVIAGRVHGHMENFQELAGYTGFDSIAGKVGLEPNVEELYSLNPRALLPRFVVLWKP